MSDFDVTPETWTVVPGPRVAVRGAPSTDAPCVGLRKRGDVLEPIAVVDGWLQLAAGQYVLIDGAPIAEFLEVVCGGSGAVGSRVQFLGSTNLHGGGTQWIVNADKTISPRDSPKLGDGTPTLGIGWGTFDYAPCYDTPPNEPEGSGDDNLVLVDATRNDVHKRFFLRTDGGQPTADPPCAGSPRRCCCAIRRSTIWC